MGICLPLVYLFFLAISIHSFQIQVPKTARLNTPMTASYRREVGEPKGWKFILRSYDPSFKDKTIVGVSVSGDFEYDDTFQVTCDKQGVFWIDVVTGDEERTPDRFITDSDDFTVVKLDSVSPTSSLKPSTISSKTTTTSSSSTTTSIQTAFTSTSTVPRTTSDPETQSSQVAFNNPQDQDLTSTSDSLSLITTSITTSTGISATSHLSGPGLIRPTYASQTNTSASVFPTSPVPTLESRARLNTGSIVGITVGVAIGLGIFVALFMFGHRRRGRHTALTNHLVPFTQSRVVEEPPSEGEKNTEDVLVPQGTTSDTDDQTTRQMDHHRHSRAESISTLPAYKHAVVDPPPTYARPLPVPTFEI